MSFGPYFLADVKTLENNKDCLIGVPCLFGVPCSIRTGVEASTEFNLLFLAGVAITGLS